MSIQAAQNELKMYTDFHRDLHSVEEGEPFGSIFHRRIEKRTWYSTTSMKLKQVSDGADEIYEVNPSFSYLLYTYMRFKLPMIKVKPNFVGKVEVAWCHNIGTNVTKMAIFKDEINEYQRWDSYWTDITSQFYQDPGHGKRENHQAGIGNLNFLEEWNTSLPPWPINVDQPWWYSADPANAFPILYKQQDTKAEHRYTFRRDIKDLLRVRRKIRRGDGEEDWVEIGGNDKIDITKYVDIGSSPTIEIPELWGRYAYLSTPEIKWRHECDTDIQKPISGDSFKKIFYIKDVGIFDTSNPVTYGGKADVSLRSDNPCLALFWMAENVDALEKNNRSNYTTNTADLNSGWDPVKMASMYSNGILFENMESDHHNVASSRKHFPSAPTEPGYHGHSYAHRSDSFDADIGVVFGSSGQTKLTCNIEDTNPFNKLLEKKDDTSDDVDVFEEDIPKASSTTTVKENKPNFHIRCRMLLLRKLVITRQLEAKKWKYYFNIE